MKKIIWIVSLVIVIVVVIFASRTRPAENSVFRIGAGLPLTGAVASFGDEFRRGAEVAVDELNKNREVVKVYFEDTALDPKKALDAVNKLVYSNNIQTLFVSAYSEAAATHQVTDLKDIPELVLWDSNPQLEEMGDKVFALGAWTPASGEIPASFVYAKGLRKAAIFGYQQEWSSSVSEAFKEKFQSLGGTITATEFSNPGATDYRSELSKIIATNPEVIYMTTEDFLKGVKQLKDLGYKGMILTSDLLDNSQIDANPGLFEGIYGSQTADPGVAETAVFAQLYKKKFSEDPKKILYGAWGYDAVHILYKAHTEAKNKELTQSLYDLNTYKGASGDIKFDSKGTSKTIPKMFVVKGGAITLVK